MIMFLIFSLSLIISSSSSRSLSKKKKKVIEPFSFCGAGKEFRKFKCRSCPENTFAPGWNDLKENWKNTLHGECIPCEYPELFEPNKMKTKCVPRSSIVISKPPVLLLPGFLGSRLRAKRIYGEYDSLMNECPGGENWIQIWPPSLRTISNLCFAKLLTIRTTEEGQAEDAEGWEVDTNPSNPLIDQGFVYGEIEDLFQKLEWSLEFFPFDWRYAPGSRSFDEKIVDRLKSKIETEYADQKIALMGHSYGSVVAYEFLSKMTDEWKERHIAYYIPLGAPFAGAVGTVISTASGYALDVPVPKVRSLSLSLSLHSSKSISVSIYLSLILSLASIIN